MRTNKYIAMGLLALGLLSGCAEKSDNSFADSNNSKLQLKIKANHTVETITRSAIEDDEAIEELNDHCIVYIRKGTDPTSGLLHKFEGITNVPEEINLSSGEYMVTVVAGEKANSEKNDSYATFKPMPFYRGDKIFNIKKNETLQLEVKCNIINTLAKIIYDSSLDQAFSESEVTIFINNRDKLTFRSSEPDSLGYFMFASNDANRNLGWSFVGKTHSGKTFTTTGIISNAKGGTNYLLNFKLQSESFEPGAGSSIDLVVVEKEFEEVETDIIISKRPELTGVDFELNALQAFSAGSDKTFSFWVNCSSPIKTLSLGCAQFPNTGIEAEIIDFMTMTLAKREELERIGISYHFTTEDKKNAKVTLASKYISSLENGNYPINISVIDENKKMSSALLSIIVSDETIATQEIATENVWAKHARVTAILQKETQDALYFQYQPVTGGNSWTTVEAQRGTNNECYALLTELSGGTTYNFRAKAGEIPSNTICQFTTEAENQLPNASFENWSGNSPLLIHGEGESMFWDSGNHGSATLNKNVTIYDEETFVSGKRSLKMVSQFVAMFGIGKFAAGNVFSGKFKGLDGTDGILEFGRPFTSRPAALSGWLKYNCGTIDYSSVSEAPKGSKDIGMIYVAIGDWDSPVEIRTKASNQKLFDKNDPNIIAYGEIRKQESVSDWTQFSIPLEYRSMTRKPKYIVIVGTASQYGDFFTGSTSSILWVDDLEIKYE